MEENFKKQIYFILQFVDSVRFIASSLSDFVNYLSEGIHRIKCKYGHDNKRCEKCPIKNTYCDCCLEYKCLCCKKNYQHKFDVKLKERFFETYQFSNNDKNKFVLLLRKDVYPNEYIGDWEKFNETSLPEKGDFYSHLNMEDITDADYVLAKIVRKDFQIKILGEYNDLYVQSDILLLACF